jgi:hypothetical protein
MFCAIGFTSDIDRIKLIFDALSWSFKNFFSTTILKKDFSKVAFFEVVCFYQCNSHVKCLCNSEDYSVDEGILGLMPGVGMRHIHGYLNESSVEQSTLIIILTNSTGAPGPAFSAYSALMEEQATPTLIYIRPEQTNFKTAGQYHGAYQPTDVGQGHHRAPELSEPLHRPASR